MKKEYRLLKNEDFQKVISRKKSFAVKSFILYYDDNDLDHTRVGISVSTKFGGAVQRNKAKRQTRAIVQQSFDVNTTKDVVIIIRNGFKAKTYQENASELISLLKRVKEGEKRHETT